MIDPETVPASPRTPEPTGGSEPGATGVVGITATVPGATAVRRFLPGPAARWRLIVYACGRVGSALLAVPANGFTSRGSGPMSRSVSTSWTPPSGP